MFTIPIYRVSCGWSTNRNWCLAWLWLSLPLTVLAQQPTDSLTARRTGVGVFGAVIGIHTDTLGVWGDVLLDSANITGNGIISLRGHSPNKPTTPQRIVSQHSQVQHLHLTSPGKTILLGDLRIEKSLTVETGVFDVSAGKLVQASTCQTRLLHSGYILNLPLWKIQSTNSKASLENTDPLIGLHSPQRLHLTDRWTEQLKQGDCYQHDYPLPELDNPVPPPRGNAVFCHKDVLIAFFVLLRQEAS